MYVFSAATRGVFFFARAGREGLMVLGYQAADSLYSGVFILYCHLTKWQREKHNTSGELSLSPAFEVCVSLVFRVLDVPGTIHLVASVECTWIQEFPTVSSYITYEFISMVVQFFHVMRYTTFSRHTENKKKQKICFFCFLFGVFFSVLNDQIMVCLVGYEESWRRNWSLYCYSARFVIILHIVSPVALQ